MTSVSCTLFDELNFLTSNNSTHVGWKNVSIDHSKVVDAANFAIDRINVRSFDLYSKKIVKLNYAQMREKPRVEYRVNMDVAITKCSKEKPLSTKKLDECLIDTKYVSRVT